MFERHWRRRLVATGAVLALVAGACTSGDNTGGGATVAPSTAAETTAPAGESPSAGAESPAGESPSGGGEGAFQPPATPVQLTLWNPFTGPDGPFFLDIVDQFNAETPNVQVTVATQPGAEYVQRLEAARDANQLPHIIAAGYDALPGHVENGLVVPIDDFAQQGGYGAEMFPAAIWNAGQWKNQRVGIPIDTHPLLFFYNKKLFRDAGLDPEAPPATREEFEAAITAIQSSTEADGYQMVSSGAPANFLVGLQFASLFYQGGGEWTSPDFSQATFNSQAGVDAAAYLAHLVNDLGVPKVDSDAEVNAFQQGTNAMMWNGIWQISRAQEALGEDLGVAPIPEIFGPGAWGGSHNLALTTAGAASPELKQGAYYFMDWFSRNSLTWAAAGQIPARNDVREQVTPEGEGILPLVADVLPVAETVRFLPSIPGAASLFDQQGSAGEAAVLAVNGEDPKTALDRAAQVQTQVLADNKSRYGF